MDKMAEKRVRYEKAVRYAFENGQLVVKCVDRSQAMALRTEMYVYFRWLDRQARFKRKPDLARAAQELIEMRKVLTLGAYANGELIIKRGDVVPTNELFDKAFENPDRPSTRDLMNELEGVEEEVMLDDVARLKKMRESQGRGEIGKVDPLRKEVKEPDFYTVLGDQVPNEKKIRRIKDRGVFEEDGKEEEVTRSNIWE